MGGGGSVGSCGKQTTAACDHSPGCKLNENQQRDINWDALLLTWKVPFREHVELKYSSSGVRTISSIRSIVTCCLRSISTHHMFTLISPRQAQTVCGKISTACGAVCTCLKNASYERSTYLVDWTYLVPRVPSTDKSNPRGTRRTASLWSESVASRKAY